jgi:hypothetical protein
MYIRTCKGYGRYLKFLSGVLVLLQLDCPSPSTQHYTRSYTAHNLSSLSTTQQDTTPQNEGKKITSRQVHNMYIYVHQISTRIPICITITSHKPFFRKANKQDQKTQHYYPITSNKTKTSQQRNLPQNIKVSIHKLKNK